MSIDPRYNEDARKLLERARGSQKLEVKKETPQIKQGKTAVLFTNRELV